MEDSKLFCLLIFRQFHTTIVSRPIWKHQNGAKLFWLLMLINFILETQWKDVWFKEMQLSGVSQAMERNGVRVFHYRWVCAMCLLLAVPLGHGVSSIYFCSQQKTWKDCPDSLSISLLNTTENYSDDGSNFKAARKKKSQWTTVTEK